MSNFEQVTLPAIIDQKQLAAYLGKSTAWCERARWEGLGPKYIKLGKHVRYKVDDVLEWMNGLNENDTHAVCKKTPKPENKGKNTKKWTDEDIAAIRARYEKGETKKSIASDYGLSVSRIHQLILSPRSSRKVMLFGKDASTLSTRALNIIGSETKKDESDPLYNSPFYRLHDSLNLSSFQDLVAAIESGEIEKVPNLGKKTIQEIKEWIASVR